MGERDKEKGKDDKISIYEYPEPQAIDFVGGFLCGILDFILIAILLVLFRDKNILDYLVVTSPCDIFIVFVAIDYLYHEYLYHRDDSHYERRD